jgi:hypothetical protein
MYASTFRMSRSERSPFQEGMFGLPSWMVVSNALSDFFLVAGAVRFAGSGTEQLIPIAFSLRSSMTTGAVSAEDASCPLRG